MKQSETSAGRLSDLLADRALGEPLDVEATRELERLLKRHPETDPASYELAAAASHLALLAAHIESLPRRLRARLLRLVRRPRLLASPWPGWLAAAAASLILFVQILDSSSPSSRSQVREAPDAVVVAWAETGDPGGADVRGQLVWSDELDTGRMSFIGLPKNDPSESQYQLWIFDAERPADYPVDGGVFDSTGPEFEVAIDPKLAVTHATLFAVTLEPPGGVVVSTRERLLLTATP